jgi:urocanate hydratase
MLFLEASAQGADIMAENHIDSNIQVTFKTSWDLCVLIGFGPFRWVCASGKPEDLLKQILACGYWKKWQNSSIGKNAG